MGKYAKAIVAVAGAGVATALTIWGPSGTVGHILVIAESMLTAAAVYLVPAPGYVGPTPKGN